MWTVNKVILELRVRREYLYWTKVGVLGKALCRRFPSLELEKNTAQSTVFSDPTSQARILFGHSAISLAQDFDFSPELNIFESVDEIMRLILGELEISAATRVGNKFHLHREFRTNEESVEFVERASRKRGCCGSLFDELTDPWFRQKKIFSFSSLWGDDKTGVKIEMNSGRSEYSIDGFAPKNIQSLIPAPRYFAAIEADFFTKQALDLSDISFSSLLSSNERSLKTRIAPLFE